MNVVRTLRRADITGVPTPVKGPTGLRAGDVVTAKRDDYFRRTHMPLPAAIEVPSDAELVVAVLAGERQQFHTLVGRYERALLRLAKSRLGRHDWAEDAVQETFLWAFKSLHSYDSRYSFRTWLWTILLNQCSRHYQRRMRQATVETNSQQPPSLSNEASPPESLLAKEQSEQLSALLAELPEAQADAVRLRFFGGLKFQEIADVQGCSLTSAKNRVRFGLLHIAERLGAPAAEFES